MQGLLFDSPNDSCIVQTVQFAAIRFQSYKDDRNLQNVWITFAMLSLLYAEFV